MKIVLVFWLTFGNIVSMKAALPTSLVEEINHTEAGRRIRAARLKSKRSLRKLAIQMGVSAPFLSDLERGRRNWSLVNFHKALRLLSK